MKTVYPDYYESFKCIADKCRHSCCVGWEIDIDSKSFDFYQSVKGEFGERLCRNISIEGTPHFVLKEDERCPFLNKNNLCDIYSKLGEKSLCQICSEHPRFYNEFSDRIEAGLGLCCEEAARLIITKKEPFKLTDIEDIEKTGNFLGRSLMFKHMQNRRLSIPQRIDKILTLTVKNRPELNTEKYLPLFESLERLDESWTKLLLTLKENKSDQKAFNNFMKDRETEYEQFICYLLYRYLGRAEFAEDTGIYTCFAALSYNLIYSIGAVIFTQKGDFTVNDQLEIMRLFSSEIEYSDENLDIILYELEKEIFGY